MLYRFGYRWKRLDLEGESELENMQHGPRNLPISYLER